MNTLFYIFSSLQLISGIMVIQSRNPVHSVLFLICVFFNAAGLLLLLGLDLFAMIFLVVYVGAIAVLFLFVVMMLNIQLAEINDKRSRYFPIVGFLGLLFLWQVFYIVDHDLIPLVATEGYQPQNVFTYEIQQGQVDEVNKTNSAYDGTSVLGLQTQQLSTTSTFYNTPLSVEDRWQNPAYLQWSHLIDTYTNIESIGLCLYTVYFVFLLLASCILLVAMIGGIVLTMHKTTQIKRQQIFQQNSRQFSKTYKKLS